MLLHEMAPRIQAWFQAMWDYPVSWNMVLAIVVGLIMLNLVILAVMLIFVWFDNRRWRRKY